MKFKLLVERKTIHQMVTVADREWDAVRPSEFVFIGVHSWFWGHESGLGCSANPDFKLKSMTLDQFTAKTTVFEELLGTIAANGDELVTLRNGRDVQIDELDNLAMRIRAGIKGYFGDNSNEYELVGGTRASDRKKPSSHVSTETSDVPKAA